MIVIGGTTLALLSGDNGDSQPSAATADEPAAPTSEDESKSGDRQSNDREPDDLDISDDPADDSAGAIDRKPTEGANGSSKSQSEVSTDDEEPTKPATRADADKANESKPLNSETSDPETSDPENANDSTTTSPDDDQDTSTKPVTETETSDPGTTDNITTLPPPDDDAPTAKSDQLATPKPGVPTIGYGLGDWSLHTTWNEVPGADSYQWYLTRRGSDKKITSGNRRSYGDKPWASVPIDASGPAKDYCLTITAISQTLPDSSPSTVCSKISSPLEASGSATASASAVVVRWNNLGPGIRYEVQTNLDGREFQKNITTSSTTTTIDLKGRFGDVCLFITAIDSSGHRIQSTQHPCVRVARQTPVAAAPPDLIAFHNKMIDEYLLDPCKSPEKRRVFVEANFAPGEDKERALNPHPSWDCERAQASLSSFDPKILRQEDLTPDHFRITLEWDNYASEYVKINGRWMFLNSASG